MQSKGERLIFRKVNDERDFNYNLFKIKIFASTTEDKYGKRNLSNQIIWLEDDHDSTIYSENKYYDEKSSILSKRNAEQICQCFKIDCDDGRYPRVNISLNNDIYEIIDEHRHTNGEKGILEAIYHIKLYIQKDY